MAGIRQHGWIRRFAAATLTLALGATAPACSTHTSHGPVQHFDGTYGATTWEYEVGDTYTDAITLVRISDGPIKLISAKPIFKTKLTFKLLGVRAYAPSQHAERDSTSYSVLDGWPPADVSSQPLEGFVVPGPQSGERYAYFQIFFGFYIQAEGKTERTGVEITYDYQGNNYTVIHPSHFVTCANLTRDACSSEDR